MKYLQEVLLYLNGLNGRNMIEVRPLNREEVNRLIFEAPEDEVKNLVKFIKEENLNIYDFLNNDKIVYKYGLIIDGRPIYLNHVVNNDGKYEVWTVVNSNVKEQKTLYKYTKMALKEALKNFSPLYATMERHMDNNIRWTEKLGWKKIYEDNEIVTLKIGE